MENDQELSEALEKYFLRLLKQRQRFRKHYKVGMHGRAHNAEQATKANELMETAWNKNLTRIDSIITEYVNFPKVQDLTTPKGDRLFDAVQNESEKPVKQHDEKVAGRQKRIDSIRHQ